MIRILSQAVDFSTANTIQRDLTTLENAVNDFMRDPSVQYERTDFFVFAEAGTTYYAVKIDYKLKPK